MIKLIASDMDGTLLNEKGQVPENFWDLERKFKDLGIYFCAASGRQYFNLKHIFSSIQDNTIFIAENGALVVFRDEIISANTMDKSDLAQWLAIEKQLDDVQLVFCGKESAYIEKPKKPALLEEMKKYYHELQIVESLEEIDDDLLKLAICDLKGSEHNSYPFFKPYEEKYQVVVSGGMWVDLMNPTTNKGSALEEIKKRFQIQDEELLIFGDYLNDYEMMSCGKYSYAMENAHPLLKEKANYIAPSNQEEGVLQVIKKSLNL